MILVVMGHSFPPDSIIILPENIKFFNKLIYSFHMPLFAFISGFLFLKFNKMKSYRNFIIKKAIRLLVPYVTFISITTILKSLVSRYAVNPVELNVNSILHHILYPGQAPVVVYWFLAVLFFIFLISPVLQHVSNMCMKYNIILTSALIIFQVWSPLKDVHIFSLDRLFDLLIFFWFGCLMARYYYEVAFYFNKPSTFIITFLLLISLNLLQSGYVGLSLIKGLIGIIMSWSFCNFYLKQEFTFLKFMEGKTYCVYLLHGVVVVIVATILRKVGVEFYLFFTIVFVTGCSGPLLISKLVSLLKWQNHTAVKILLGL
ncbi:MAG: acyltransferase [Pelosinus sp.]|nr:acyltransferase [Pelosinus sp.]